jgi:hypothetical protein
MKIKWLDSISGTVNGDLKGVKRGQVSDVSEVMAERLIKQGLAQANWNRDCAF